MNINLKVLGESNKGLVKYYALVVLCFITSIGLIIIHLLEDNTVPSDQCENIFDDPKMVAAYLIGSVGFIVTMYVTFKNNNSKKIKNIMNKLK